MPQLCETVTEGTITRWFKQVGDQVKADEPLFEVSTDKVDSEVPAPAAGVLSEILVAEGDTVDVAVRLAVISDAGTAPAAAQPPAAPPPAPAPAPAAAPAAAPAPAPAPVARASGDEVVPFDNIRRRTAEHMVRSKATSAHVYTSVKVDFERVDRVRRANQAEWKAEEGFSLTYLPFIVRAFCDVVHEYPHVNASVDGDSLIVHRDLHLGIAVDLDFRGLVAPVIRNADGKRMRLIAREIRDLAARAKSKQLGP